MNTSIEYMMERYILNKMSAKEAQDFDRLLASDPNFAKEFENTLAAHQLITQAGRIELKDKLESFEKRKSSTFSDKILISTWVKRALPIAAILIVFFGVYQFVILNNDITGGEIYNTYYENYSNPSVVRDSETSTQVNWEEAASLYREKDFENAITFFKKSEVPSYLSAFYIGMSSLPKKDPNFEKTSENFEIVLDSDNDYRQQTLWYKGLTLLKLNRKEEAKKLFNKIVKEKGYNYLKAEEIINLDIK